MADVKAIFWDLGEVMYSSADSPTQDIKRSKYFGYIPLLLYVKSHNKPLAEKALARYEEHRKKNIQISKTDAVNIEILDRCKDLMQQMHRGVITNYDFWEQSLDRIEVSTSRFDPETLDRYFLTNYELHDEIVDIMRVAPVAYRQGIISLMDKKMINFLREYENLDNLVDRELQFVSCETYPLDSKLIKPNKEIYQHALRQMNVHGDNHNKPRLVAEECLFVDDGIKNIEGAKEAGFQTVHYQNREQGLAELKQKIKGIESFEVSKF